MRKLWLLAWIDLRRTVVEKASFFWMLVLPVAMMWFFGNLGGGQSGPPRVTLTVVDEDRDWLAREFVALLADDAVNLKELTPDQAKAAEKKVRTLVLPAGFTANVLKGEKQLLEVARDKGADEDFSRAADAHVLRAVTRTLGLLVEMGIDGKLPREVDPVVAAAEFRRLASRPRQVELQVTTAGEGRPVPGGRAQSVPGILTMTVLMMTLIYGGVFLTIERQSGMLRRQVTLPLSRVELLVGKLAGRLLLASVQIAILLAVGRFVFHVHFGRSPAGLLLLLAAYAFCVSGIATFLGAVFRTPEQASGIGWIASMIMAALGGCWWPSEIMPPWLWRAAHAFPTAWAMDAFHALISFGRGIEAVVVPAAVLVAFGAAFTALGARYLRTA